MSNLTTGDRVAALYPNEAWGEGTVVEVVTKRGQKPLVVRRDDGTLGHFHREQVESANASPFSTFAPERVPATLIEVGVWFAYMADHSDIPHPDDPADSIAWSTPDLVELFADPERRIRYDRAMAAAFAICEVEGVDIYYLGLGDCECGHPMSGHQTGTGPWEGFCGDLDCKCEEPVMA